MVHWLVLEAHRQFKIQVKLTTRKVKPVGGCLSHLKGEKKGLEKSPNYMNPKWIPQVTMECTVPPWNVLSLLQNNGMSPVRTRFSPVLVFDAFRLVVYGMSPVGPVPHGKGVLPSTGVPWLQINLAWNEPGRTCSTWGTSLAQ